MDDQGRAYDEQAADYDVLIEKLVPDYRAFNELIPVLLSNPRHVLDIGCGTGNTAHEVLARYSDVETTCVDPSPAMLCGARAKIKDRAVFVESSIESFQTDRQFDAVTSVLVLHNIKTESERASVYAKIYDRLNRGGVYISVDIIEGECRKSREIYSRLWRDFMLRGLPPDEVDGRWLPLHREKDRPIKISTLLGMLELAGFRAVDIVYKRMNFALTLAFK